MNPSYLLTYERSDKTTSAVLVILFCFSLLKLALFGYIVCVSLWDYKINSWLRHIWRWVFKLQTRITYFLLTSFWVKAIIEAEERDFSIFGMSQTLLILIAAVMIAIEFLFAFVLETQFYYILPTSNFLSSKNNDLKTTALLQKLIIQVLTIIFSSHVRNNAWVTSIIGLALSIIREYQFAARLPLYNFKALALQRGILSVVLPLNLIYFLHTILKAASVEGANINFVILTWIVISLLGIKGGHEALKAQFLSLLCTNKKDSLEIRLHKVYATEQVKDSEYKPTEKSAKYGWAYLVSNHQRIRILDIFGLNSTRDLSELGDCPKAALNKVFLWYFEDLLAKHPKNFLINLHTAFTCFRNSEPYVKTIKIATQMEQNMWAPNYLSCSLLLLEIEKSILEDQSTTQDERELNLLRFVQSKVFMENIKKKMLKQTDLYLKVCNNILGDTANIEEIYSSAQKIRTLKTKIQKRIDHASIALPEHFISPLLCFAKYSLVANHLPRDFDRYCQSYNQSYFKYEKIFKDANLVEQNLYQDSNAMLLVSIQKADFGKILYCSSSLVSLVGGNTVKTFIGTPISRFLAPSLRDFYDNLAFQVIQSQGKGFLNETQRTYVFHKEKYLVEIDFHIKYHPYLTQGLCASVIWRRVPSTAEYMLLREDGTIEGASKGLTRILKINNYEGGPGTFIPSELISPELHKVNSAFNMVVRKMKGSSSNMSLEKATEIYNAFLSGSQKLEISPYENDRGSPDGNKAEPLGFYCRIEVIQLGDLLLKLVNLRPLDHENLPRDSFEAEIESDIIEIEKEPQLSPTDLSRFQGAITARRGKEDEQGSEDLTEGEERATYAQQISLFTHHQQSNVTSPTSPMQSQMDLLPLNSAVSTSRRFLFDGNLSNNRKTTNFASSPDSPDMKKERVKTGINNKVLFSSEDNIFEENEEGSEELNDKKHVKEKIHKYQGSQHSSQKSSEKASDKAFKAAIVTKSYPRSFIILCVAFYGVVLLTFIGQIVMKSSSDTTMKDLQVKKNLLKLSNDRAYKASLIQVNAMGGRLQNIGFVQPGGALLSLPTLIANLQIRMNDMKTANDQMLQYVYSLDKEFQDLLFVKDVTMNGTYLESNDTDTYEEVNTFQATQDITNAVKALNGLAQPMSAAGFSLFNYLTINIADDYSFKNIEITNIFIQSVEKQKKAYTTIINLCLILTPFLLLGIGILLIGIIWNQYRIEQKNLKAFIKISPTGVKDVSEQLVKFRKSLVNDESFENKWFSNMSEDFEVLPEFEQTSTYSKKHNTQMIKHQEFRQRYFKYIFRVFFYISVLISITIWDLIETKEAIDVIYNRQGQLQFANYICNRATSGYSAFNLAFVMNNTMNVEHKPALQALYDAAKDIQAIQTEIPTRFQETDKSYNPEVKSIIYDNNPTCKGFLPDNILYCNLLIAKGQPANMIIANSAYLSLLKGKYQDFLEADRSSLTTIMASAYKNIQLILPNFAVLAYEAKMISDIMDASLDEKINENKNARRVIITVFSISLAIVSVLIWIDILRVIRNVYNDFKKVLQIFPPNLVLSSYLLKKFLRKTANHLMFA